MPSVEVARSATALERAVYFSNRRERRLFGFLHDTDRRSADVAAVFCHPLGEEKQKSYRAYVHFSRYLSARGIPSLRFDCDGFGDSESDSVEATIESMVGDTQDAMTFASSALGVSRFVLIGARLGATIASLASGSDRVRGLVLTSPVVTGAAYWEGLLRAQQLSFVTQGRRPKKKADLLAELAEQGRLEIEAMELSAEMIAQLSAIDLTRQVGDAPPPALVTAVADDKPSCEESERLASAYRERGGAVDLLLDEPQDFWSTGALYSRYRPAALFERTIAWLHQPTY